jgi:hypothetical protein
MAKGTRGSAVPPPRGRRTSTTAATHVVAREGGSLLPASAARRTRVMAATTTNCICQLQKRFSQLPGWRSSRGKAASTSEVRPRNRRATRISTPATTAMSRVSNTAPARKSENTSRRPRWMRRATGSRCSLFCAHTQPQKLGSAPVRGRTRCQSSDMGMLRP